MGLDLSNWTAMAWSQKAYDVSNAFAEVEAGAPVLGADAEEAEAASEELGAAAEEAEADVEEVVTSCGDTRQGMRGVYCVSEDWI